MLLEWIGVFALLFGISVAAALLTDETWWLYGAIIGAVFGAAMAFMVGMVSFFSGELMLLLAGVSIVALVAALRAVDFSDDETGAWGAFVVTVLISSVALMAYFGTSIYTVLMAPLALGGIAAWVVVRNNYGFGWSLPLSARARADLADAEEDVAWAEKGKQIAESVNPDTVTDYSKAGQRRAVHFKRTLPDNNRQPPTDNRETLSERGPSWFEKKLDPRARRENLEDESQRSH